ncbi:hypothetical protein BGZ99_002973 [Dissophora globulifera]|uniref:Zn(2)-C6 fungal-type domain-containing protein n=1 Tax=Dissophora globulifera TaxID=979702 RepID=A0A9P6RLP0_9FUNG|nr:hypothetical protein BGZ99_002973 [Dissophora globulifera]
MPSIPSPAFSDELENSEIHQHPSSTKPTPQRRKRPLAKRICTSCREKKARCELPDLFVASSRQPVIESKRCHRCRVLDVDCIVWDGDRKRKPKLPLRDDREQYDLAEDRSSRASWSPLSHLADAAEVIGATHVFPDAPSSPRLPFLVQHPLEVVASRPAPESELFFRPSTDHFAKGSPRPSTPQRIQDHCSSHASTSLHRSNPISAPVTQPEIAQGASSPEPLFDQDEGASQQARSASQPAGKKAAFVARPPHRTWRSVWRTISVLVDYAAQQPQFTRYLVHRVASPDRGVGPITILDIIDRKECLELETSLACQAILSSIRNVQVVQAFELLLAHEPSLVGTTICGGQDEQAHRGNGLAGESLLTSALRISRELGLDKAIHILHKLLESPRDETKDKHSVELLSTSSLWVSLRIWEGHYTFIKPVTRVMRDLEEEAEIAKCMIAVDDSGYKLDDRSMDTENFSASSRSVPKSEEEEKFRSAGRTILAYRIQSMALVQSSLAKVEDILATDNGDAPTPKSKTSLQVQEKIVSAVLQALEKGDKIEESREMDMAHYAMCEPASLLEDWSHLESSTILSTLCTFGICCLYTGQFEVVFSSKSFIDALQQDPELGEHVVDACKLFLEGAAFVLISYFVIQQNHDGRLLSMVQAAQRLEEFDGNLYGAERRADEEESAEAPIMSICQIAGKFIKDSAETLHKWRLASTIYRKPGRNFMKRCTKDSTDASQSATTLEAANNTQDNTPQPSRASERSYHGHPSTIGQSSRGAALEPGTAQSSHPSANGSYNETYGSMPGASSQPIPIDTALLGEPLPFTFPTQAWPSALESPREFVSTEHLLTAAFPEAVNGTGLAYDVQMFDSIFESLFHH